jgi:allophanate hydrolase-like protein
MNFHSLCYGRIEPPAAGGTPTRRESVLSVRLAVNGTLMRGLALNGNLLAAGATFVRETTTSSSYRLWSIGDRHPAMIRVAQGGAAIAVEVWDVPDAGLAAVLLGEPAGLCVGKVRLADGEETLGVLGEPLLCEGQREITQYGGWRAYVEATGSSAR